MTVITTEEFIKRSKEVHGDRYDYSVSTYNGFRKHVNIVCSIHGIFKQTPVKHYSGNGCHKCGQISSNKKTPKQQKIS
jgi:hypothetical protein